MAQQPMPRNRAELRALLAETRAYALQDAADVARGARRTGLDPVEETQRAARISLQDAAELNPELLEDCAHSVIRASCSICKSTH